MIEEKSKSDAMRTSQGLSSVRSPVHQGYMGYLTQKQLQQLQKFKKEQESDRDSCISGHSNKGRRMKLRHVDEDKKSFKCTTFFVIEKVLGVARDLK